MSAYAEHYKDLKDALDDLNCPGYVRDALRFMFDRNIIDPPLCPETTLDNYGDHRICSKPLGHRGHHSTGGGWLMTHEWPQEIR
jgi:hypothetical protein